MAVEIRGICKKCKAAKVLYKDGFCKSCYLTENPQKGKKKAVVSRGCKSCSRNKRQ